MKPIPQPSPSLSSSLAPSAKDRAAVLAGTPLAILGVMIWEAHFKVELQTAAAVAIGGVFATVAGYFWHVVTTLIDRAIERSLK